MTNYSAKHWAIKAEKSARDAESYASGIDLSNYATKSDLQSVRNEFEEEDVSIKNEINTLEDLIESNTSGINQQIANKANKDLSDVSQAGKTTVVGWGMPDYSAGVTLSKGMEFTPTKDGVIEYKVYCSSSEDGFYIREDNAEGRIISGGSNRVSGYIHFAGQVSVVSNKKYYLSAGGTVESLNFFPYKGVK